MVLVALLVCLIPTTIGGLLSAIGIAGMDRVARFNVLAMSGRAVEAAGDVDVLLLDKTGTITFGNRMASRIEPLPGVSPRRRWPTRRCSASLRDETPEGRSVVDPGRGAAGRCRRPAATAIAEVIPFSAERRTSGVRPRRRHARSSRAPSTPSPRPVDGHHGDPPRSCSALTDEIAGLGATPLAVSVDDRVLGLIELKDTVKPGMARAVRGAPPDGHPDRS